MITIVRKTARTAISLVLAILVQATGPATIADSGILVSTANPAHASLLVPYSENRAGCISLASSLRLVGDVDGDGYVNVGDLQLLVASWGKADGDPGFNTEADFDCDRYINVGDLQLLVSNWGAHP